MTTIRQSRLRWQCPLNECLKMTRCGQRPLSLSLIFSFFLLLLLERPWMDTLYYNLLLNDLARNSLQKEATGQIIYLRFTRTPLKQSLRVASHLCSRASSGGNQSLQSEVEVNICGIQLLFVFLDAEKIEKTTAVRVHSMVILEATSLEITKVTR